MKVTDEMISRFLSWKLPESFAPDGGISFQRTYFGPGNVEHKHEPIGTNLLDYGQAKAMLEYVLGDYRSESKEAGGG